MRRTGIRIVALAGAVTVSAVAAQSWRQRHELGLARAELERGEYLTALGRLEFLESTRVPWTGGRKDELAYWLGVCRWRAGRRKEALAALARVPDGADYGTRTAAMMAVGLLEQGHWRAAERRLERALAREATDLDTIRGQLEQLYRMQVRTEDAARLLRAGCATVSDPVGVLRALWRTERGTPPLATICQALDIGERLDPRDERVWLGRARVATLMGRLDEAEAWLSRCTDPGAHPDEPVWRAWLDWSRAARRPETARMALRALGPARLGPAGRLAWRAWFAQQEGDVAAERRALESWLTLEPRHPAILTRLAVLTRAAGQADRTASLVAAKAEVDRALDAYNERMLDGDPLGRASDRLALGRLAEAIGRRFDAGIWYTLVLRVEPGNADARSALTRLEAFEPGAAATILNDLDPWDADSVATSTAPSRVSRDREAGRRAWFVDDANSAGLAFTFRNGETPIRQMPVALSGGVALLDYDGDGWLDVFALQGGTFPPEPGAAPFGDRLYRNRGDGTFEDVTGRSGLAALRGGYGQGVAVGDVDNDRRPDLFVTRWRRYALYYNRGDGTFEDVTQAWGLGGDRDWPTSSAFADLDGDGDLDLYVCHYVAWDAEDPRLCRNQATYAFMSCNPLTCPARPDHVFRNDRGRFTDVTSDAGILDRNGRGLGVVAADFDDDGKIDLFVANDKSANYLFHNLGGFRFEEVGESAGVAASAEGGYQAGMGVACGDVDGDGRLDLAVTNYYGESTTLYRNLGSGLFTDRTAATGLGGASRLLLGFGAAFLDADNDGRLELLTANGHTDDLGDTPFRMPAQLLVGSDDGRFLDVTDTSGPAMSIRHLGRGLAVGDLDNDGRTDALLVAQNEPIVFLHNQTEPKGHGVRFRLEGRRSNRDGVGARVTIRVGTQRRLGERYGGGSYLSACDPRLHFGLGTARRIDEVEVRWPSGQVDIFRDLEPDETYHLGEGDPVANRVQVGRRRPAAP
jgi:tetratricopeptide (TPR) repeat protein